MLAMVYATNVKKPMDGRTAKGLRIRQQVRESILAAYDELIREGIPVPTARETAERAGLSLRVIFNHFPDLRALRLAAFQRMQAASDQFFPPQIPENASAAERLRIFVQTHTRRLEFVTPLHRTAAMVERIDPDVAAATKMARNTARRELEQTLGPALKAFPRGEKRSLLTTLHMVCVWSTWELLRTHYRLSPARACAIVTSAALAILDAAERRVRSANR